VALIDESLVPQRVEADGRHLVIQIPCFDEAESLPATLADLPREVPGFSTVTWLVIDDGSSDGTAEVARAHGVDHVVTVSENRGLANAFMTGIDASLRLGADVIVNTDADNQYRADCIPDLVAPIVAGEADLVIGERPIEAVEEFSWVKKRLQRVGSGVVRAFSDTAVRDAPSGFRAFDREAALRVQVFNRYTYTLETIIQAGWEGLRIKAVDVEVNPVTRPSRLVRSIPRYVWRSMTTIVRSYALYKPFRFFAAVGVIPAIGSVLLVCRWLYLQLFTSDIASRVPSLVVAAVLGIVAVQLWVFAFLADLLSVNRRVLSEIRVSERRREFGDGGASAMEHSRPTGARP
jgi:glycosyltransferase involved in cell wall biosynthesis